MWVHLGNDTSLILSSFTYTNVENSEQMIIIGFVPFEYDKFSCTEPNITFFGGQGGQNYKLCERLNGKLKVGIPPPPPRTCSF
jgi:hypothetical protein